MVSKCKQCGAKQIKYPAWRGQENGEAFSFDKIIWKNLFKMDFMSVLFVLCIVLMYTGYGHDISKCEQVIEDPCGFCNSSGCCSKLNIDTTISNQEPDIDYSAIIVPGFEE